MIRPPNTYFTATAEQHYIYFDNQYYISVFIQTICYTRSWEILAKEDAFDQIVTNEISPDVLASLNKSDMVATNIEKPTILFKQLRNNIPAIKYRFSKEFIRDYQNFSGKIYDEATVLTPRLRDRVKAVTVNVESQKDKYPPEIMSLMQLCHRMKSTRLKTAKDYSKLADAIANIN